MPWIKVKRTPVTSPTITKLPANAINGNASVYRMGAAIAEVQIFATALLAVDGRDGYRDYGKRRISGIEEFLGVYCFGTETSGGFMHLGDVVPLHRRSVIAELPPPAPVMSPGLGTGPPIYVAGNSQAYDSSRSDLLILPAGGVVITVLPTVFVWAWQA